MTSLEGWELWNEPDWTWNTAAAGSFDAGWVRTYQAVRALDAVTPIVGPSISVYNYAFMASFLAYAKANNALPNVITWHQLTTGSSSGVGANVADFKALQQRRPAGEGCAQLRGRLGLRRTRLGHAGA
jgi:hypothetical protein